MISILPSLVIDAGAKASSAFFSNNTSWSNKFVELKESILCLAVPPPYGIFSSSLAITSYGISVFPKIAQAKFL